MAKTKRAANPLAWIRNLHEAGTIRRRADEAAEMLAEIERMEAVIATRKRDLRSLNARAESEAKSLGWSDAQIAAAKRGETLMEDGCSYPGVEACA